MGLKVKGAGGVFHAILYHVVSSCQEFFCPVLGIGDEKKAGRVRDRWERRDSTRDSSDGTNEASERRSLTGGRAALVTNFLCR